MSLALEAELVEVSLDRIHRGREAYGRWIASEESRDLDGERLEEWVDAMHYGAMMSVIARRRG